MGALLFEEFGSWSVGFYGSAVMALVAAGLALGLRAANASARSRQVALGTPEAVR